MAGIGVGWRLGQDDEPVDRDALGDRYIPRRSRRCRSSPPEPDRFDIRRPNAREQVSFGKGRHFCIGAPLARLELEVLLEEIVRRYPALTLVEEQHVEYIRTIAFRGPKRLMASLGSRSVSVPTG